MIKKFLISVILIIPILFGCSDKFDINQFASELPDGYNGKIFFYCAHNYKSVSDTGVRSIIKVRYALED